MHQLLWKNKPVVLCRFLSAVSPCQSANCAVRCVSVWTCVANRTSTTAACRVCARPPACVQQQHRTIGTGLVRVTKTLFTQKLCLLHRPNNWQTTCIRQHHCLASDSHLSTAATTPVQNPLVKTQHPCDRRTVLLGASHFSVPSATMAMTPTRATTPTQVEDKEIGSSVDLLMEDEKTRSQLKQIFLTAVEAVMPRPMLEKVVHFNPSLQLLTVEDRSYKVKRNVFVVGAGKGVLGMGRVIEDLLGDHIIKGLLSIPVGAREVFKKSGKIDLLLAPGSKILVQEGAVNNLPDLNAFRCARDIHKLISNLTANDIVIVLLSGGGSALLPYPADPLTLDDIQKTTQEMFNHGATISDVNTVRKHLEVLKGGGLARAACPAQVISFIISDVIGDSLELIASGPTVKETNAPHRCLEVIKRIGATESIPKAVIQYLENKRAQEARKCHLMADPRGGVFSTESAAARSKMDWAKVHNVVVGSNAISCAAAAIRAEQDNFVTHILTHSLSGEAKKVGSLLAKLSQYILACYQPKTVTTQDSSLIKLELELAHSGITKSQLNEISNKATHAHNCDQSLCIIAGGETIVNLHGSGKGGRNQEMVLAAGIQLQKTFMVEKRKPKTSIFFMSAGTDGQDGPTEAAGAMVDENFMIDAASQGLEPQVYLDNNDSYSLWSTFAGGRDLIITGLTGTNVMDIQIMLVKV